MAEPPTDVWSSSFWFTVVQKYFEGYLHRLLASFPQSSVLRLEDSLYLSGLERFPGTIPAALEFCRAHPAHFFTPAILEWIATRSFDRENYALILEWASLEKDESALRFLSRIRPPLEMPPDERENAVAVWKKKLQKKPQPSATMLSIQNQLYLLSADREEKFLILRDCLPFLYWRSPVIWFERMQEHCRQYPGDDERLRKYYLDCIHHGPEGCHALGAWFGISLLGAGEAEAWLLDLVRSRFSPETHVLREQWELLAGWQPVSPAVRTGLLNWWYGLSITESHPAFESRQRALLFLDDDPSRLHELFGALARDSFSSVGVGGWRSFSPLCGPRMIDFIRFTLGRDRQVPPVFSGPDFLPFPGFLTHVPAKDIRQTVELLAAGLENQTRTSDRSRVMLLSRLIVELLREYSRRGAPSPETGEKTPGGAFHPVTGGEPDDASVDMSWVNSMLEFFTQEKNLGFTAMAHTVHFIWGDGRLPPGAQHIVHGLWTVGINHLATCLDSPVPEPHSSPYIRSVLSSLAGLMRQMPALSPGSHLATDEPDPEGEVSLPAVDSSLFPSLWGILSTLVRQTRNESVFLLAGCIGNHLARHAGIAQRAQWWTVLHNSSADLSAAGHQLADTVRANFRLHTLFSTLDNTRRGFPAGQSPDTTTFLRLLRQAVQQFPDVPGPFPGFWTGIWEKAFEAWKIEPKAHLPAGIVGTGWTGFMEKQPRLPAAVSGLSGNAGFMPLLRPAPEPSFPQA